MKSDPKNNTAEEIWVTNIRKGDHEAFEALFKEYYFILARFSWRYVGSESIAEEMVQEVMASIWETRESFEITGSLRAYLFKAVRNRSLDYLKHQRVKQKYIDSHRNKEDHSFIDIEFNDEERESRIRMAIEREIEALPHRSRMTFKLHRHDGLTYEEIAEVMDVSIKTVESQMVRTLKKLRERLSYLLSFILISGL